MAADVTAGTAIKSATNITLTTTTSTECRPNHAQTAAGTHPHTHTTGTNLYPTRASELSVAGASTVVSLLALVWLFLRSVRLRIGLGMRGGVIDALGGWSTEWKREGRGPYAKSRCPFIRIQELSDGLSGHGRTLRVAREYTVPSMGSKTKRRSQTLNRFDAATTPSLPLRRGQSAVHCKPILQSRDSYFDFDESRGNTGDPMRQRRERLKHTHNDHEADRNGLTTQSRTKGLHERRQHGVWSPHSGSCIGIQEGRREESRKHHMSLNRKDAAWGKV